MTPSEPREAALQALYEAEHQAGAIPNGLGGRAHRLVEGVLTHIEELDAAIGDVAVGWRVERMPPVDRNILRLGLYELRYSPDVPVGVILAEAVKLAKRYSTERSGPFINGVLARLADLERAASA